MRNRNQAHSLNVTLLMAVTVIIAGMTSAFGVGLELIPTLTGDTANQARAITPDGRYVVGLSGSRGFLWDAGSGGAAINVLSSDGAQSTVANGVGYRTSGGGTEVIVSGLTSSGPAEYMLTVGGTTFGAKRRNTTLSANTMGAANQVGSMTGSDVYYVSSSQNAANQPVYLSYGSGPWVATMTYSSKGISGGDKSLMNGVSAIGRAVGQRGAATASNKAYVADYAAGTPAVYNLTTLNDGLNGGVNTLGELWAVSQDGKAVFGRSFLTGTSGDYHSFKTTISGFGAGKVQGAVNPLPELVGTGGSVSRTIAYGASADGVYAVGMDYVSTEKAALWWTGDANPANWAVMDLTQYAADRNILGGWVRLTRAYSVGVDALGEPVATGVGVWSPDGGTTVYTRGWVMVIPEPGTISLLALGVCGLLVFRRRK